MKSHLLFFLIFFIYIGCEADHHESTLTESTSVDMIESTFALDDMNSIHQQSNDAQVISKDMDLNRTRVDMLATDMGMMNIIQPDMRQQDMTEPDLMDQDMMIHSERSLIRAPCTFDQPQDTQINPMPQTCMEMYQHSSTLTSGCYTLRQLNEDEDHGYCWRKKALVLLVNNDIDTEIHPDDTDGDGVIDRGVNQGQNHPTDPFRTSPYEVASQLQQEVYDYFAEISYDSLQYDLEIYWAGSGYYPRPNVAPEDLTNERWYRLQRERPTFANTTLMHDICMRRGGMTAEEWRSFDVIVTIVNYGTTTSGSQWRSEELPVGEQCDEIATVWRNYVVMKQFRGWNRLGTLFHEIIHGLARDPFPEPSIGHSESVHPQTGEYTEYGDLSDVMGVSSNRGHISLPQKLFLRYLPLDLMAQVPLTTPVQEVRIAPLEPKQKEANELRGVRVEVNQGMAYYVAVRRSIGNDSRLPEVFHQGAVIKRAKIISEANKSFIVDPTPESVSDRSLDYVLLPHRTFSDHENQIHISAITSDDRGVDLIIRRHESSITPPTIDRVDILPVYDDSETIVAYQFTAYASAGEDEIAQDELLYFWKLGARDAIYINQNFKGGQTMQIPTQELTYELWLLVSDQRGGETWYLMPNVTPK
jgi:hypothetical protein